MHGGIESLEGIQDFTNLKELVLFNYPDFVTQVNNADLQQRIDADLKNNIQYADLSNNKKLVNVNLGRNIALESININGLTELIGLTLEGCQNLSSIDLSSNTKLEWLNLGFNNKITEVDLTNLLELGRLHLRATGNLNSLEIFCRPLLKSLIQSELKLGITRDRLKATGWPPIAAISLKALATAL